MTKDFNRWFKENTPKEGLSENTTFTKQFLNDAWNNGFLAGAETREENSDPFGNVYVSDLQSENREFRKRVEHAKDIIQDLLSCLYSVEYDHVSDLEEAEQFLKENE